MMKPSYLITSIKKTKRKDPGNIYTGFNQDQDLWRVNAVNGMNPMNDFQLFFETDVQAAAFSEWQLYTQAEMAQRMKPFGSFTVHEIERKMRFFKTNQYTGQAEMADIGKVSMSGQFGAYWDWYFLGQEGNRLAVGRAYDPLAFFEIIAAMTESALAVLERASRERRASIVQQREGDAKYWEDVLAGRIPTWWTIYKQGQDAVLKKDWVINGILRPAGWKIVYVPGDPNFRDYQTGSFQPGLAGDPEGLTYTISFEYFARINMNP